MILEPIGKHSRETKIKDFLKDKDKIKFQILNLHTCEFFLKEVIQSVEKFFDYKIIFDIKSVSSHSITYNEINQMFRKCSEYNIFGVFIVFTSFGLTSHGAYVVENHIGSIREKLSILYPDIYELQAILEDKDKNKVVGINQYTYPWDSAKSWEENVKLVTNINGFRDALLGGIVACLP